MLLLGTGCGSQEAPQPRWHGEGGHRWQALEVGAESEPGFEAVDASDTGVGLVNTLSEEAFISNRHLANGSGVAIGDVNGDDWPDLYVARLEGANALYLNQGGFRFSAVDSLGGAALDGEFSTGAALEDIDGDRDLDLLVTTLGGPNAVFRNDGRGHFTQYEAGLHSGEGSTTMALADVDSDGDLDLYVGNYKRLALRDSLPPDQITFNKMVERTGQGDYQVVPRFQDEYRVEIIGSQLLRLEYAEPDRFYLNDGTGRFKEVSMTNGTFRKADGAPLEEAPRDWTLMVRFQDMNGDGAVDLYVCNDFESPDHVWLGDGAGRFRAVDPLALRKTSHATMAVDFTDLDRDGSTDFFLADMLGQTYEAKQTQLGLQLPVPEEVGAIRNRTQESQNTLFVNRGDGTWAEVAQLAEVAASGWTWSALFLDVDLDGYDDLLLTTGHAYDAMDADVQTRLASRSGKRSREWRRAVLEYPDLNLPNVAFRNRGDLSFEEIPEGWGLGVEADVAHGMATGDLDRDGDLDVVVSRLNRPVGIYRNTGTAPRVAVRLRGKAPNTRGTGAKVVVRSAGVPVQEREMIAAGQYVSDSEAVLAFAVREGPVEIKVKWPSGAERRVKGGIDRLYEIYEPGAERPASDTVVSNPTDEDARSTPGNTVPSLGQQVSSQREASDEAATEEGTPSASDVPSDTLRREAAMLSDSK